MNRAILPTNLDDNMPMNEFDPKDFRKALGSFATGVTIVTACDPSGEPSGLTVNSFASVSLDPPLILWSLSLYTPVLDAFRDCTHYAVNVLAADQVDLSNSFAKPGDSKHRFDGLTYESGCGGAPLLPGCCAWFECRNETQHAGGDHLIFVGRVEKYRREERVPLLFQGGAYRQLATP